MWWIIAGWVAQAHPFQEQFVGHRLHLTVKPTDLSASITIEVPVALLEEHFQQSGESEKKAWLRDWMTELKSDMRTQWLMEWNGERRQWQAVQCTDPVFQEASSFLVFKCELSVSSDEPLETLSLLDQILIAEPSVYWTSVDLSRSIRLLETDRLSWSDELETRYQSTLDRWQMESVSREVRLAVSSRNIWAQIDRNWGVQVYGDTEVIDLKTAFLPRDWIGEWQRARISWWLMLAGVLFGGVGVIRSSEQSRWLILLSVVLSITPILPWRWRFACVAVFFMIGAGDTRRRWIWWWCGLGMLLMPLWWVTIFWLLVYFGHILVKNVRET